VRALKLVWLGLLLAVLAFLGAGLALPNSWHVERSIVVNAPPEVIAARIANLRGWREWSGWDVDPKATWEFGGPELNGVGQPGAWMTWNGPHIGRGRLELVTVLPAEKIEADQAIESDTVNARATWKLEKKKDGTATEVTWTDEGKSPPIVGGYMKGMLEDMLAHNMQSGLDNLKKLAESDAAKGRAGP
jgi:hypothetical protein